MGGSTVTSPGTIDKIALKEDMKEVKENKKQRKRKKGIYRSMVKQIEFYLSDANLRHSKFLLPIYEASPWICIKTFLTFNKVAGMLSELLGENSKENVREAELCKALEVIPSETIKLSECKKMLGRKTPFTPSSQSEVDSCTVYVENIPADADHDFLRNLFSTYGEVVYVSMPKFKSGRSKGFAFVEFDSEELVNKVLTEFTNVEVSHPSDLVSVKTFNEEPGDKNFQERKRKMTENTTEGSKIKKIKISDTSPVDGEHKNEMDDKILDVKIDECENRISEIKVMSKVMWKKCRNAYLNDQRKNFALCKQSFKKHKNQIVKDKESTDSKEKTFHSKIERKEDLKNLQPKHLQPQKIASKDLVAGVVVKILIPSGVDDVQVLKRSIREGLEGEAVAYVDAKIGYENVYVRCLDTSQAARLEAVELGDHWEKVIISGGEEKEYHRKIERDKEEKRSGKVKVKKIRTKEKLIQKAEVVKSTHVYFE